MKTIKYKGFRITILEYGDERLPVYKSIRSNDYYVETEGRLKIMTNGMLNELHNGEGRDE